MFRPSDRTSSLFDQPAALRQFVELYHQRFSRDFVVLDRQKTILADSSDEDRVVGSLSTRTAITKSD